MLRAKIHMATVTDSNLMYEGSLTVDGEILNAASIRPYEQIMVSNLHTGERFETYVIAGEKNTGVICLNGPTARKGTKGDKIIIFCYGYYKEDEIVNFNPKIVRLDENNRIVK